MPKKKPFRWKKGLAVGVPRNPITGTPKKRRRGRGISLTVSTEPKRVRQGRKLPDTDEGQREVKRWTGSMPNRFWSKGENGLWSSQERTVADREAAWRWALPEKIPAPPS